MAGRALRDGRRVRAHPLLRECFLANVAASDGRIVRLDDFGFTDVDFLKINTERVETLVLIEEIGGYQVRQGCEPGSAGALLLSLGARHIARCADQNDLYAWP